MKPFIPSWLDDAGLSPAEMRVFVHLLRSANKTSGIAWPAYKRMTAICDLSKSTVRRSIEELERRKLIEKMPKPYGGSCRYKILPLVSPQGQMDASNSSTTDTIEAPPIVPPQDCNCPSDETSIVPPEGQEGNPRKVIQRRESNTLVETIWNITPPKGRERSSRRALENALKKAKWLPPEDEIIRSLEAWNRSEAWTKDNGQFIPGIHRFIQDQKWEVTPSSANGSKSTCCPAVNTGRRIATIQEA
jgi:hypothetical protein